ncbi:hypothetical protein Cantr_07332 [Candida viswanathii]|uniref:Uncharacterized protein n=1 Tax=Candida viswanathii TaxID=5486 RepID=A0A367Y0Y0_9ASCO|nr:hypothetical protein Cantr_07332 [Candida viswanathii]
MSSQFMRFPSRRSTVYSTKGIVASTQPLANYADYQSPKPKLTLDDFKSHTSTVVDPIKLNFQDYNVWEIPPNGHGLVALLALGIIQNSTIWENQLNRGANFNLSPGLSNCLEGGKRPYHTIIPGMITNSDGSLYAGFGNMGGFAQPVCHVQHVLNLTVFGMTPQQLIDSQDLC